MDPIRKSIRQKLMERRGRKERTPVVTDMEDINIDLSHHNEETTLMMHELNTLNERVRYLTSLNTDLVDFLHSLVKALDHKNDIDLGDARKDFTVLLNRSGRRKFYQQTKRL